MISASIDSAKEIGKVELDLSPSPGQYEKTNHSPRNGNDFHSNEWGSISSKEHKEAIMLEAALFGRTSEGSGYQFPYSPHQFMHNGLDRMSGLFRQPIPCPPSPNLVAQRLIRNQQDDEYLASLQADRNKEMKAMQEAEARHLDEQAAGEAALQEEKQKKEESYRKLEEEQEIERQLGANEASLPHEPTLDVENAVTLEVRMPDGSCRGC